MKHYKVMHVAEKLGVSASTIRKYVNEGKLQCDYTPAGQRIFTQKHIDDFLGKSDTEKRIVFYVRSSKGSKTAMAHQVDELTAEYGEPMKAYKDSGSGLNENRKGLWRMIHDAEKAKFDVIAVTHQDRLTRFGYSHLEKLFSLCGVKVVYLHDDKKSYEDELMSDFMSLIASFAGKFYRLRSKENQIRLLDTVKENLDE